MKEIWKDIPNYEGLYQVSNLGRVKSFHQPKKFGSPSEFFLKTTVANNGYCQVTLYADGHRSKFLVHRLVASAFLDNPHNFPQVNHKDENRENNSADNLEWCSCAYNNNYGTATARYIETRSKSICQYTNSGKLIAVYRSAQVAATLLGYDANQIRRACNTGRTSRGYLWKYSSTTFPSP